MEQTEKGLKIAANFPQLVDLIKAGHTIQDACKELNLCSRSIYYYLNEEQRNTIQHARREFDLYGIGSLSVDPLATVEGFNRKYEEYLPGAKSYRSAYEAAEREYINRFNRRKYSSFESFRQSRTQWVKIRKKKEEQGRQAA